MRYVYKVAGTIRRYESGEPASIDTESRIHIELDDGRSAGLGETILLTEEEARVLGKRVALSLEIVSLPSATPREQVGVSETAEGVTISAPAARLSPSSTTPEME